MDTKQFISETDFFREHEVAVKSFLIKHTDDNTVIKQKLSSIFSELIITAAKVCGIRCYQIIDLANDLYDFLSGSARKLLYHPVTCFLIFQPDGILCVWETIPDFSLRQKTEMEALITGSHTYMLLISPCESGYEVSGSFCNCQ